MIPTPHIQLKDKDLIAKTVIMPGDPLRAKFIADTYLEDVVLINSIRNMLGYTGMYKGKKVTVMGSGMGMPSVGIYSFELFSFYDVDNIIRIGSAGSYSKDVNLYDIVIAKDAYSESTFADIVLGKSNVDMLKGSDKLNQSLIKSAERLNYDFHFDTIHSSDVFYRNNFDDYKSIFEQKNAICVEMESFALFANAMKTKKNAACILTISDSLVTHEATSAEQRQNAFTKMMDIALNMEF
jgi:purine-nucleoside phosphorylase